MIYDRGQSEKLIQDYPDEHRKGSIKPRNMLISSEIDKILKRESKIGGFLQEYEIISEKLAVDFMQRDYDVDSNDQQYRACNFFSHNRSHNNVLPCDHARLLYNRPNDRLFHRHRPTR